MNSQSASTRTWDHEDECLIAEMPPEFGRQVAKGRELCPEDFGVQLQFLDSAFQDLAALSFATALAAIVAAHEPDERAAALAKLLDHIRRTDELTKPKPSLLDSYLLLTIHLKKLVVECVSPSRITGVLARMMAVPHRHSVIVDKRNYFNHDVSKATTIPPTDAQRMENSFRQEIFETLGYWWEYNLGYVDGNVIRFTKSRLGRLTVPSERFTDLPQVPPSILAASGGRHLMPAVLLSESEKNLYNLSPFVFYERPVSPVGVLDVAYRVLAFRRSGSGKRAPITVSLWSRLFSEPSVEHIVVGTDTKALGESLRRNGDDVRLGATPLTLEQCAEAFGAAEREVQDLEFVVDEPQSRRTVLLPRNAAMRLVIKDDSGHGVLVDPNGVCCVVKARAAGNSKDVSVKILRADFLKAAEEGFAVERRFLEFAEQAKTPHIVRYLGSGRVRIRAEKIGAESAATRMWIGKEFIATEYVGFSLRTRIAVNRSVLRETAARAEQDLLALAVVKHIARALYMVERISHAMEEIYFKTTRQVPYQDTVVDVHFLHRDIKPENLLDAGNGDIRLCDFNSAYSPLLHGSDHVGAISPVFYSSSEAATDNTWRAEDNAHLSRQYCAPEIWARPRLYSETADVFSVGMVTDELLWGETRDTQREVGEHDGYADGKWTLFTPPENCGDLAIAAASVRIVAELQEFVAEENVTRTRPPFWFDLRELVSRATACVDQGRWTMTELREHAEKAGLALRAFTARLCREHIRKALQSSSVKDLEHALLFVGAAFGYQSEPLALPKCEEKCGRGSGAPCLLDGVGRAAKALESRVLAMVTGDCSGMEADHLQTILHEKEAREILAQCGEALSDCVGLVEAAPNEIGKETDHHRFRKATTFWRDVFIGSLVVEPAAREQPPPCQEGPEATRGSSLADDILRFIAVAGKPGNSRFGSLRGEEGYE